MAYLNKLHADIFFETFGSAGPWITFLNGYTRSSQDFRFIAQKMARQNFRILLIDNRGSGRTVTKNTFVSDDWVLDVYDLWKHLDISESHLVGFSMGGIISQHIAQRFPFCLTSLTLVSSTYRKEHVQRTRSWDGPLEHVLSVLGEYVDPSFVQKNPLLLRSMAQRIVEANQNGSFSEKSHAQVAALQTFNAEPINFSQFTKPTLILHGDQDKIIVPAAAHELQQAIAHSTLKIYQDTGHLLLIEQSASLVQDLLDFMESAQKPSA
jgi:pimeloyl-ACP methyl ester carboxylesterase